MFYEEIVPLLTTFLIGTSAGILLLTIYQKIQLKSIHQTTEQLLQKAEQDVDTLMREKEITLKKMEVDQEKLLEKKWEKERNKLLEEEIRLKKREDKLENRIATVEKKLINTEKKEAVLLNNSQEIEKKEQELINQKEVFLQEMESLAGLTAKEAKQLLLEKMTSDVKSDAAKFLKRTLKETKEQAEKEASKIIATAINRLAVPCVSETTVNTVPLPHEETKGRIIGKEGRNIRTLERTTGVNIIIDDTPNSVVLSGFDPVRLHIAKTALTELVHDGRIHPTRIEEVVEKVKRETAKEIQTFGEDAALRVGIMNLHPEIILLLGKLKFRHSYGQNILEHSLEVSHLMGLMAGELSLDVHLAKRIGLLHDMGKAVTHEIEGTHALIGYDLALKYGESEEVANGIGCHHFEIEAATIEGSLCNSADAISASRPGARIEAIEEYVKRLKKLEAIAHTFPGVEKAYALQAGRELRVFVLPDMIDDEGALNLARNLSKRIEKDLSYPGKIKISITREKNIVEYAY